MNKKIIGAMLVVALCCTLIGCSPGDRSLGPALYTEDVLPATASSYGVGSATYPYDEGHFQNLYAGGVPVGAGVTDHGALTGLLDDDHPQYQEESEKGAASGYASLDASAEVTEDLANIDDTPVNAETDEPITSNWAYDHNAAMLSATVHPNTAMCRAYLASTQVDFLNTLLGRVELANTTFDPGSNFKTGAWQQGVGDAGSNATTIVDADPTTGTGFVAAMNYAQVVWDAGASSGFIQSIDGATQVTIAKNVGADFGVGDTYTINKAHYLVPVSGTYQVFGVVGILWSSVAADDQYNGEIIINGVSSAVAVVLCPIIGHVYIPIIDFIHLSTGDVVALGHRHYVDAGGVDVYGSGAGAHTYLAISLIQAD